jgi:hypothetical protein
MPNLQNTVLPYKEKVAQMVKKYPALFQPEGSLLKRLHPDVLIVHYFIKLN